MGEVRVQRKQIRGRGNININFAKGLGAAISMRLLPLILLQEMAHDLLLSLLCAICF